MTTRKTDEQLCAAIVDNTGEAIIVVQNQRIRYCNNRAVELSGFSEVELRSVSWQKLVHPHDREMVLSECIRVSKRGESTGVYSIRIRDRDKKTKWLELHHRQILWEDKAATLVFFRDITERKRLESQFLQAQKMEAVGRLAGGIAHDFNNFLTVILGYTEILEKELLSRNADPKHAQATREAALKAAALTQKLLAFSRKQHLEPKIISPNKLVTGIESILKRLVGEKSEVVLNIGGRIGSIRADANQLEQVILNLATNANDAMEQGGKLIISTENVEFSEESVKPKPEMRPGRYVMLSVSDTGCGMDEATKAHLFEPFFTTKESGRGTGLGLATVYGIIKQSKGFIYVYSEIGRGTTFKLYFPRTDDRPLEEPAGAPPSQKLEGSERILVLEEEQQVLSLIEGMLIRRGYSVLTANNGQAALEQSRNDPGSIDLLITDLGIPDMNVREVWETIKGEHPHCRVLFISFDSCCSTVLA